ncbi:MAG: hypothetical protein ACREC0_06810 [Methylocella sp.]
MRFWINLRIDEVVATGLLRALAGGLSMGGPVAGELITEATREDHPQGEQ